MKVALTADPEIPVPPEFYGGIERIVDLLAAGLSDRGHEVTVFAHPASQPKAELCGWPGARSGSPADVIRNARKLAIETRRRQFDVVHSFSRIAYLTPILAAAVPKIMSYQREITRRAVSLGLRLSGGSLSFTAVGQAMIDRARPPGHWTVVPNGVPLERFDCNDFVSEQAPLVFLGRVEPIKGAHTAIEVARRTGVSLVIAGNIEPQHQAYFDARIKPQLCDAIRFVGPVDDRSKNTLLGGARAFLMPIQWDEPFGIVMIEAMACGTPVIALDRGAAREVIDHGRTGFVCGSIEDMVDAVARAPELDRRACRREVSLRFSADAIVSQYEALYRQAIVRGRRDSNLDAGASAT
jgi:glycosyltransferase involved in cell wall biosynthesis